MQEQFRTVLDWFATNGVLALAALLIVAGLGIPSPASIGVLAAGALVRTGRMDLLPAFVAAVFGSTLGQVGSYWLGRKGLKKLFRRLRESKTWSKAHARYQERRAMTIFCSRWLLTPLAMPINLIAGMEKCPWWTFTLLAGAGNAVWVLLYGAVGYAVGSTWGKLGEAAKYMEYAGATLGIAVVAYFIIRHRMKRAQVRVGG